MKKLFFVLILSAIFYLALPVYAEKATVDMRGECESMVSVPELVLTTSYGKLVYDFSLSKNELSKMAQQAGIFEQGVFAAGLALVNIDSEFELETLTQTMDNNDRCILPQRFKVYIGFSRPTIYMAKELQPGSCNYNLVLRHEQVHQQINKQALEYFIPIIRRELSEIIKKIPPAYVGRMDSEDKISAALTQKYYNAVTPLVNHLRDQILEEQRKLDNRSNYRKESGICRSFNRKHR